VVVAILDTGVDAFAPGLLTTSTGETKLIEVRDFSGQGDWEVTAAELTSEDDQSPLIFQHTDGLQLRGADQLAIPPVADDLVRQQLASPTVGVFPT
jgi:hypothetical protein